ncbi:hypothetical protein [Azospirillum argentinense]|uniref:Uncharacterized protein n=1 Tax=Azospirillum argentinense TaxID=2970906 RepID=A0A5B0KKS3_9PROT|nr:hypothetical protein [Azospirillum argentinense]KAA1052535.1 hypothetical protein FH063_004212 [Azospirillum argentinense]
MSAMTMIQWLAKTYEKGAAVANGISSTTEVIKFIDGIWEDHLRYARSANDGCNHILLISDELKSNDDWKRRWTTGTRFSYSRTGSTTFWHPQETFEPDGSPSMVFHGSEHKFNHSNAPSEDIITASRKSTGCAYCLRDACMRFSQQAKKHDLSIPGLNCTALFDKAKK